jgi:2-C-methyl-D-erythritol 4-phosphate cytidylyltransferase / 2-C-methyl-D-erythritol 2,4-cyclodiphosphate synthase
VLLPLAGAPLLVHTVRAFQAHPAVTDIAVIARRADFPALERAFAAGAARARLLPWIAGGAQRQDSVYNGLAALEEHPPDWVLVHDGARPCCSAALIGRVLAGLERAPGAVPVLPLSDTLRRIRDGRGEVVQREGMFRTQTPQGFHWEAIWNAHRAAKEQGLLATDDAQLLEARGVPLLFVEGDADNVKITAAQDLRFAQWLLEHRE